MLYRLIRGVPMSKKILVMDDDPTIADLLREALADEGYETYMTTQSLRFYDAVSEHKPDLILLDLMMQYLDGRDELKLMRSEEHTSELQSHSDLVCRLLLEKKK